jgi:hypothetical protein
MGTRAFDRCDDLAVDFFRTHGWVLVTALDDTGTVRLRGWVEEIAAWPDAGEWVHYREMTDDGPKLCRTENFVPSHTGMRQLLTTGTVPETAGALLGEAAVLYKEKINYKAAGGAGFAAHQDAPAYPFVRTHVSCMLAVDGASIDNGCLEVVDGMHRELLPTDERGCIPEDVAVGLPWEPVEVPAGAALWFHSRLPHRSGSNSSARDRRALYPTYNARAEGDPRDAYYRAKRDELANRGPDDDRVSLSLIGDFQSRPV